MYIGASSRVAAASRERSGKRQRCRRSWVGLDRTLRLIVFVDSARAERDFTLPHLACGLLRAILSVVEVVLRKLGPKPGRPVTGRLVRAPRRGAVVVIEFPDGLHEYVTTPVRRILRIAGQEVYYLQTTNSRYRLEVRRSVAVPAENTFVR